MRSIHLWLFFACALSCGDDIYYLEDGPLSDFPPDKWGVEVGTWNTHLELATSPTVMGQYSIKFNDSYTSRIGYELLPCVPGQVFEGRTWLYSADTAAAGDDAHVYVEWYDSSESSLSTDDIHPDGPISAADTWEEITAQLEAPASAAYYSVKVDVDLTGGGGGAMYCGYAGVEPFPPAFFAYRATSSQTIPHNTATKVAFNAETYDHGSNFDHATNYRFTATAAGIHAIESLITLVPSVSYNGSTAYLYLFKNGVNWLTMNKVTLPAGGGYELLHASYPCLLLAAGDYLEIYAFHTDNQNLFISNSVHHHFMGARVE